LVKFVRGESLNQKEGRIRRKDMVWEEMVEKGLDRTD
jgi:hypothetical protein